MLKFPDAVHHHDWWLLLAIFVATVVVSASAGFAMPDDTLQWIMYLVPTFGALLIASIANAQNMALARVTVITFTAWLICVSMVLGHGSYAFATLNFPLQDARLLSFDTALGIDLVALRTAVGQSETASSILTFAYYKTGNQMLLGVVILFLLRDDFRRLRKSASIYTLGATATMVLSTLIPALGAYPYLNMSAVDSGYLTNAGTDGYVAHYLALRDGTLRVFPTTDWCGITTFPSFHTIMTLTAAYAVRPIRWLFWPSALFSCFVIFATLPVGGHYSIDIIGGLAIFAASVACVERRDRVHAVAASPARRRVLQVGETAAISV